MRPFLRWWVVFCLSLVTLGVLQYTDFTTTLWVEDLSKLSFAILGLFGICAAWIGVYTKQATQGVVKNFKIKPLWFFAESMVGLGLIGTLVGFYWVLSSAFGALDPSNIDAIKTAMGDVGTGISTALLTSLIGISSSMITKLQLVNLEHLIDGKVQK